MSNHQSQTVYLEKAAPVDESTRSSGIWSHSCYYPHTLTLKAALINQPIHVGPNCCIVKLSYFLVPSAHFGIIIQWVSGRKRVSGRATRSPPHARLTQREVQSISFQVWPPIPGVLQVYNFSLKTEKSPNQAHEYLSSLFLQYLILHDAGGKSCGQLLETLFLHRHCSLRVHPERRLSIVREVHFRAILVHHASLAS